MPIASKTLFYGEMAKPNLVNYWMKKNKVMPVIKDWHQPNNEACPQNKNINRDCECARPKRNRKPYRVCRVHCLEDIPHRVKPDIIMEVHPGGRLILREKGRPMRFSYGTTIGKIYGRLVMNEALAKARAKAAKRAAGRKARKAVRK